VLWDREGRKRASVGVGAAPWLSRSAPVVMVVVVGLSEGDSMIRDGGLCWRWRSVAGNAASRGVVVGVL
jgi:hypothetical protein